MTIVIVMYLMSAMLANWAATAFGQAALPIVALLIIPFDLAARDIMHERWQGTWLAAKMAALIAAGSALSWLTATGSPSVCIASCIAFAAAACTDTAVYAIMRSSPRHTRMNTSNVASAIVDSIAFPLIAFGAASPMLCATQAAAKIIGGVVWTSILVRLFFRC